MRKMLLNSKILLTDVKCGDILA